MRSCIVLLLELLATVATAQAQGHPNGYPYRAAQSTGSVPWKATLQIYPFEGKAFTIPLPNPFGQPLAKGVYSPDGKTLYARWPWELLHPQPGSFVKVEFDPIRFTELPGSGAIGAVDSLAMSPRLDKIFFSGTAMRSCGIYEFNISDGKVKQLVRNPTCPPLDPRERWESLSVAPDGTRATALRHQGELDLLDLTNGKITPLGNGFTAAEWSPDGKWLAVNKLPGRGTLLLDAQNLAPEKTLPWTILKWSPDSRYLLARRPDLLCFFSESGTLWTVDVESGKETRIASSRCQIYTIGIQWVSSDISP